MFSSIVGTRSVVLASKSPRRIDILRKLGLQFDVVGSSFAEDLDKSQFASPEEYVVTNARIKTLEVYQQLIKKAVESGGRVPDIVIGGDTVCVLGQHEILEKPATHDEARRMLQRQRDAGATRVVTGMCIVLHDGAQDPAKVDPQSPARIVTFTESTDVEFGDAAATTDADIAAYVATEDPMDKAGAYGYQSMAGCLIKGINGCFYNVVGLPAHRLYVELRRALSNN